MSDAGVVCLDDVGTVLEGQVIHQHVNLRLQAGEVLALIGASGAGKTLLLREIIGLQKPTSGDVRVFGRSLTQGGARDHTGLRRRWGVLFQQGALFSALSVFDNIAFPLRELRAFDARHIGDLVMLKLGMVGLAPGDAYKMPAELSGGMVKRVALARALALEPELLLLDEPTAGLDPIASDRFVELLTGLRSELGLTVIMVTHDLDTLADACDRVAVLADRTLLKAGTLDEVMTLQHPFAQDFFHGRRGRRTLTGRR